jgi:4-hydroxybenzoyl-CoA reductase subunit beta
VDEVAKILAGEGGRAQLLAGGTDLVPNMKRRQQTPAVVVSLRRVAELRGVAADGVGARLGSCVTLAEAAASPELARWPALVEAAGSVATPHIRNAGTVGGNLCLDTRCNYYDQNFEWRKAIDFCMKKDGGVCWVAPGSPRCWAVSSTDLAPALIALGAQVRLASADGERVIPLAQLYVDDGIVYLSKRADELVTEVRLPDPTGWRSTYRKLRRRGAFDFPVLGVAAAARFAPDGTVLDARLVLGAVASHPVECDASSLVGHPLTDERIAPVVERASRLAKPLDNTDFSIGWRKKVAHAYLGAALRSLRPTG